MKAIHLTTGGNASILNRQQCIVIKMGIYTKLCKNVLMTWKLVYTKNAQINAFSSCMLNSDFYFSVNWMDIELSLIHI